MGRRPDRPPPPTPKTATPPTGPACRVGCIERPLVWKLAEYPLIHVRAEASLRIEQLGTKRKFWFKDPDLGLCLCKIAREGTGEHWSEKAASEIAAYRGRATSWGFWMGCHAWCRRCLFRLVARWFTGMSCCGSATQVMVKQADRFRRRGIGWTPSGMFYPNFPVSCHSTGIHLKESGKPEKCSPAISCLMP